MLFGVVGVVVCVFGGLVGVGCEQLAPPPAEEPKPPKPGFVLARPFPDIRSLNDVAVGAVDEERISSAYAVGTDGAILRYDGVAWVDESPPVDNDFESVSVVVDDNGNETVLVVGSGGVVLQREVTRGVGSWSLLPSPVTEHLFGVWVRADDDAFIVGDRGTVLRWDGASVTQLVDEVLIDAPVAEGAPALRFPISDPLKSVMGRGGDDVWTVGPRGVVYHFDGTAFSRDDSQTNRPLVDVFTDAGIWAATTDGVLLRRRDDGWHDDEFVTPAPVFLQSVWTRGDGDVFAVGLSETLFHNEAGLWNLTFIEDQAELRAIDGAELLRPEGTPDDVATRREIIAVGAGGRIVRGPLVLPNAGEATLATRPAEILEE